jgi:hypothetical protein
MSSFVAQQVTRSHRIHLPCAVERAFPLFEPLGEKLWAHSWNPVMLYPASGPTEVGAVFTTQHANEPTKIWTIIAYEKEQAHIAYFNVLPHCYTSRIDVRCEANKAQTTSANITYTLTALTPHGNTYIEQFTEEEHYQAYISSWETAICYYLLHGDMLPHEED